MFDNTNTFGGVLKQVCSVGAAVAMLATVSTAQAGTQTIEKAFEGWGASTQFDFTQVQTVDGVDYFGWNPLVVDGKYQGGKFLIDIMLPKALSGGDNFDFVVDADNSKTDSDGDFLFHYANNGPVGSWTDSDKIMAKNYNSGWGAPENDLPSGASLTEIDADEFRIEIDGSLVSGDLSYAWLSPLGGVPPQFGWTGEAAVISTWNNSNLPDNGFATVAVPSPSAALAGLALIGSTLLTRRRQADR